MRRRAFLGTGVAVGGLVTGGTVYSEVFSAPSGEPAGEVTPEVVHVDDCIEGWCYSVEIEPPKLAPGERGEVVFETENIAVVGWVTGLDQIKYDFDREHADPEPWAENHIYPPIWHWEEPRDVTLTMPVVADEDMEPGAYDHGIGISESVQGPGTRVDFQILIE